MRAAVIGTHWGAVHVAALRAAGVEVVAVAGRDAQRAWTAAEQLDVPSAFGTVRELADLGLDLISVATPAASHVEVISELPADVPVLCEKPAIGLSGSGALPTRSEPVWVNYAFAFLGGAERAAGALAELGPVLHATARSTHDLGRLAVTPQEMFFELVPHPCSWLVRLLGGARPGPLGSGDQQRVRVHCGEVPVDLECAPAPGLDGLRHEVVVQAEGGLVTLTGTYREGATWVFEAPTVQLGDGEVRVLGDPETGPVDPWYRANERAIGAVVSTLRGAPPDERLVDWDTAVSIDLAIRAGLSGGSEHD